MQTTLSEEEIEFIIDEARYGELESLQQIFKEIDPKLVFTIKDSLSDSTLVHMASGNGHLETVKFISGLAKDNKTSEEHLKEFINSQNSSGNTALHWASLNGHLSVVEYLCENFEVDPFLKNKAGHDSIFEAENNNKEQVEEYFLKKFSYDPEDVDDQEDNGGKESSDVIEPQYKPGTEIENVTKEAIEAKAKLEQETKNLKI